MHIPKEYGKRVGYGAGIALATKAAKLPIVGNRAAMLEGKLRRSRAKSAGKYTDDLAYVSEETSMKMAERFKKKMKGPTGFRRVLTGEGARARGLYATQLAAERAQDKLPNKAVELREQAENKSYQANQLEEKNRKDLENIKVTDKAGAQYNYTEIKDATKYATKDSEEAEAALKEHSTTGKTQLDDRIKELAEAIGDLDRVLIDPDIGKEKKAEAQVEKGKKVREQTKLTDNYNKQESNLKNNVTIAKDKEQDLKSTLLTATRAAVSIPGLVSNQQSAQDLRKQAADDNTQARKITKKFWQDAMDIVGKQAKHKVTVENNDVYEDDNLGKMRERFLNSNPQLIPEDQKRVVTDPNTPSLVGKEIFDEGELKYRTRRLGSRALEDLPLSALSDSHAVMGQLADGMERLSASLKAQNLSLDNKGRVLDTHTDKEVTDQRQLFHIFKTAFQGLDSFRASQSPRKTVFVDQALNQLFDILERKAKGLGTTADEDKIVDRATKFDRSIVNAVVNNMFRTAATRFRFN